MAVNKETTGSILAREMGAFFSASRPKSIIAPSDDSRKIVVTSSSASSDVASPKSPLMSRGMWALNERRILIPGLSSVDNEQKAEAQNTPAAAPAA